MKRYLCVSLAVLVCSLFFGNALLAQGPPAAPPTPTTTVKLQVVLSRYDGDKKLSSVPYSLSLVPGQPGNIRAGAEIPVHTNPPAYTMQQVGSQIDATVNQTTDGKYRLSLTVTDRSIVTGAQTAAQSGVANIPAFRNMSSNSNAILGNGETMQFTSSTDKASNETFKIDVTLTVGNK